MRKVLNNFTSGGSMPRLSIVERRRARQRRLTAKRKDQELVKLFEALTGDVLRDPPVQPSPEDVVAGHRVDDDVAERQGGLSTSQWNPSGFGGGDSGSEQDEDSNHEATGRQNPSIPGQRQRRSKRIPVSAMKSDYIYDVVAQKAQKEQRKTPAREVEDAFCPELPATPAALPLPHPTPPSSPQADQAGIPGAEQFGLDAQEGDCPAMDTQEGDAGDAGEYALDAGDDAGEYAPDAGEYAPDDGNDERNQGNEGGDGRGDDSDEQDGDWWGDGSDEQDGDGRGWRLK